ncbi:MAG: hypothetical protein IEMM0006_1930 [bacterium]|nr:MAG: hypothetical protein IEMM0006_1930 [bacterium]
MWTGNFWMGGMWIFPLIMLVGVLLFIFLVFGRWNYGSFWYHHDRNAYPPDSNETPLEILKKRYAKGEITKAEFEQIKKDML